jgi:hypothetical protein
MVFGPTGAMSRARCTLQEAETLPMPESLINPLGYVEGEGPGSDQNLLQHRAADVGQAEVVAVEPVLPDCLTPPRENRLPSLRCLITVDL